MILNQRWWLDCRRGRRMGGEKHWENDLQVIVTCAR